jgi:myo-inositol 2-dehydrogenase / D-chiro-inositol 1-dehydrogenase
VLPDFYITGANPWKLEGEINDAYVTEHTNLINSIRAGKPLNEMKQAAESTLVGIVGRMAAYSGQIVTWEEALQSPSLMPEKLEWGPMPTPPVPQPGSSSN